MRSRRQDGYHWRRSWGRHCHPINTKHAPLFNDLQQNIDSNLKQNCHKQQDQTYAAGSIVTVVDADHAVDDHGSVDWVHAGLALVVVNDSHVSIVHVGRTGSICMVKVATCTYISFHIFLVFNISAKCENGEVKTLICWITKQLLQSVVNIGVFALNITSSAFDNHTHSQLFHSH